MIEKICTLSVSMALLLSTAPTYGKLNLADKTANAAVGKSDTVLSVTDTYGLQRGNNTDLTQLINDDYLPKIEKTRVTLPPLEKSDLDNFFQGSYGKQITPAQLAGELKRNIIEEENGWVGSKSRYDNNTGYEPNLYYSRKGFEGTSIVTAPVHDLDETANPIQKVLAGNLSLTTVVNDILRTHPKGNVTVTIPVAQAGAILGIWKRNHWTTLVMKISNGKIVKNDLLDSKGWLSGIYGGGLRIQNLLPKDAAPVKSHFLGHQGLLNHNDCGRFTASYIKTIHTGGVPQQQTIKQATSFFSKLFRW